MPLGTLACRTSAWRPALPVFPLMCPLQSSRRWFKDLDHTINEADPDGAPVSQLWSGPALTVASSWGNEPVDGGLLLFLSLCVSAFQVSQINWRMPKDDLLERKLERNRMGNWRGVAIGWRNMRHQFQWCSLKAFSGSRQSGVALRKQNG